MSPTNGFTNAGEDEPLLGQTGDASQKEGMSIASNFWLGTAGIAQGGAFILFGIVWGLIFSQPELMLFSAHPLLNSAGILFVVQAILVLQPTHTSSQKRAGTWIHSAANGIGVGALIAGLVVIVHNKNLQKHGHFESIHAILGLTTYLLLFLQALVGFTQYWVPQIYGGEDNAKKIWKYHRISGYLTLALLLAAVCAATQTGYNVGVLHMRLWAVLVCSVLILAGVLPRIKKQKLGF